MIHAINLLVIVALMAASVVVEPARAATAPLAQQSGAWYYLLSDGLGSVRQWANAAGQVTYAARYAPFGALLWQQGTAPGPWGFAREFQDPTGLIYLPTISKLNEMEQANTFARKSLG